MESVQPSFLFWPGVTGLLILAIAVGFLLYVFTGSSRLVAGVLFLGLLLLLGLGFMRSAGYNGPPRAPLVELAPPRMPISSAQLGPAANTLLCDVPAKGHRFVYVIDCSASMGQGGPASPLESVKESLKRSVTALQRNHRFQMLAFDRGLGRCFDAASEQLASADNSTVVQAFEWIDGLVADKGADETKRFIAGDALYEALNLQPDVIYFVTDGQVAQPTDSRLELLRKWNTAGRTVLHVIQLVPEVQQASQANAGKTKWLADLANKHRGQFRQVAIADLPREEPRESKQAPPSAAVAATTPAKPPDWVKHPPQPLQRFGDVRRSVATSGPCPDEESCRESLDMALLASAAGYVDQVVEHGAGRKLIDDPAARERILQYLAANVVKELYSEPYDAPDLRIENGVVRHARLEYNEPAANFFRQEWRMVVQEERLLLLAGGVGVFLAFVGTIFAYLKIDTATRGYYSGRLRLTAGAMIIGLIVAAVALFG